MTVSGTPPFTPYTITLPSPVTVPGAQFELMMDVGIPITIATPAGWIGGVSGSYESTKVLTAATVGPHNRFYSDGVNWNMLSVSGYNSGGDLTATRVQRWSVRDQQYQHHDYLCAEGLADVHRSHDRGDPNDLGRPHS